MPEKPIEEVLQKKNKALEKDLSSVRRASSVRR